MTGTVLQVNASLGGIPKTPMAEAVLTAEGVQGDRHAHPQYHGGPQQAVLVIASEALGELNTAGFVLVPGALGENITTTGLDRKAWRSGQRWRIGQSAVIEFTKLREPCRTLSRFGPGIQKAVYDAQAQDGDPESRHWGIGGFYAAVIEPGVVRAGDAIELHIE